MSMTSPQRRAAAIREGTGDGPWPGHEYARGWGVFGVPFDTGHLLALRVFPQSSFTPYRTVWHRDPEGRWSIHADAPHPDLACPRYYAPACEHTGPAKIGIDWTGPRTVRITVDEPALEWVVNVHSSPLLGLANAAAALMPAASWKSPALLHLRERIARTLGMGRIELAAVTPSGHATTRMPERMYYIDESTATLDGVNLGSPTRLAANPTIGSDPLPTRGVLAFGQAVWRIQDEAEFQRMVDLCRMEAADSGVAER